MWTFCCGMPRSGSTLQFLLTKALVESTPNGESLGFVNNPEQFLSERARLDGQMHNVVLKSHRFLPEFGEVFEQQEGKAVYVYRDLRDAVVSINKQRNMPFDYGHAQHFVTRALAMYEDWQAIDNLHITSYERLVSNTKDEIWRIAEYLGISITDDIATRIDAEHGLEMQASYINSFDFESDGIKKASAKYDPETQLHYNHINSGASDQWRTQLNREQIVFIESLAGDWLDRKGYKLESTRDERIQTLATNRQRRRSGKDQD